MLQFILTTILFLALGTILFLVVRSLPRIGEDPAVRRTNIWERLLASEIPERIDAVVTNVLAKFLRRTKVVVLKLDNRITKFLEKSKSISTTHAGQRAIFPPVAEKGPETTEERKLETDSNPPPERGS